MKILNKIFSLLKEFHSKEDTLGEMTWQMKRGLHGSHTLGLANATSVCDVMHGLQFTV